MNNVFGPYDEVDWSVMKRLRNNIKEERQLADWSSLRRAKLDKEALECFIHQNSQ
jgi:hypothetical protein